MIRTNWTIPWTVLRLSDVKTSLCIIVLIVRGCFDQTLHFALEAHALLLHNYDKLSCIFSCKLLIRNHMIFLVQCGVNKHLLIFSKTTNFVSLWKNLFMLIYSKLRSKSCDYLYKICINLVSICLDLLVLRKFRWKPISKALRTHSSPSSKKDNWWQVRVDIGSGEG